MRGITWLHLSDWHQEGKDFDRLVVRNALIEDLEGRNEISQDLAKIDFIVFSGDLAYNGKNEEYQTAKTELLEPILRATKVGPDRLFIIPGNHDLDRDMFDFFLKGLLDLLKKSYSQVKEFLDQEDNRTKAFGPFQDFAAFVTAFTGQKQPNYADVREWEIEGKKIALIGLNSAWTCGRNKDSSGEIDDKGVIFLGEPQIYYPLKQISKADINIAVLHHPFDWLDQYDRDKVEEHLMRKFDFILRGHQHKLEAEKKEGTYGQCIIITTGSGYDERIPKDPIYLNSYNFVHLDFEAGKVSIFLRRWCEHQKKWIGDSDSILHGKLEFSLPIIPAGVSAKGLKEWAGSTFTTMALVFTEIEDPPDRGSKLWKEEMDKVGLLHFQQARELIIKYNGYEINATGDSILVAFRTAIEALYFSLELYSNTRSAEIKIRAGIHVGVVHMDENDSLGQIVKYTYRVESQAKEAEIWVSDRAKTDIEAENGVYEQLKWEEKSDRGLKGFSGKHKLWSIIIDDIDRATIGSNVEVKKLKPSEIQEHYDVSLYNYHSENEKAEELASILEKMGFTVWFDSWFLPPGISSQQAFMKTLDNSESCAIIIGGKTNESWLKEASELVLHWQKADASRRILPILLSDANIDINAFPELEDWWIDFRGSSNREFTCHKLKCGVQGIPIGRWPQKKQSEANTSSINDNRSINFTRDEDIFNSNSIAKHNAERKNDRK